MFGQGGPVKVFVVMRPADFRKGIDGLALAAQEMFGLYPWNWTTTPPKEACELSRRLIHYTPPFQSNHPVNTAECWFSAIAAVRVSRRCRSGP